MKYEITKVTRYYKFGAEVTRERIVTRTASKDDVLALARKQGADIDELLDDLDSMGCADFKGYMVSEYPF